MKLKNVSSVQDFMMTLSKTNGRVWLESADGDKFNLKSSLSCYVALGRLISEKGSELELFCSEPDDERLFYDFFSDHPDSL